MTKKEFLSASLPYGLMFKNRIDDTIERLSGVDTYITANWIAPQYPNGTICVYSSIDHSSMWGINEITPIVRNISDLTKECIQSDYNDGKPFIPLTEFYNQCNSAYYANKVYPYIFQKQLFENLPFFIIQQLIKWHFDLITEDCEKVYVTDEFNPYK